MQLVSDKSVRDFKGNSNRPLLSILKFYYKFLKFHCPASVVHPSLTLQRMRLLPDGYFCLQAFDTLSEQEKAVLCA